MTEQWWAEPPRSTMAAMSGVTLKVHRGIS